MCIDCQVGVGGGGGAEGPVVASWLGRGMRWWPGAPGMVHPGPEWGELGGGRVSALSSPVRLQHHTTGINCERCLPGFFRAPDQPLDSPHACRREWGQPREGGSWGTGVSGGPPVLLQEARPGSPPPCPRWGGRASPVAPDSGSHEAPVPAQAAAASRTSWTGRVRT